MNETLNIPGPTNRELLIEKLVAEYRKDLEVLTLADLVAHFRFNELVITELKQLG